MKTKGPPVHTGTQLVLPLCLLLYYINALNIIWMHRQLMDNEDVDFFFFFSSYNSSSRAWVILPLGNSWSQNVTIPASIYWLIINSLFQVLDKLWVRKPENIWGLRLNVHFNRMLRIGATYFCSLLWFDFISRGKQVGHKQPSALLGRLSKSLTETPLRNRRRNGRKLDPSNKSPLLSDSLRYIRLTALTQTPPF